MVLLEPIFGSKYNLRDLNSLGDLCRVTEMKLLSRDEIVLPQRVFGLLFHVPLVFHLGKGDNPESCLVKEGKLSL